MACALVKFVILGTTQVKVSRQKCGMVQYITGIFSGAKFHHMRSPIQLKILQKIWFSAIFQPIAATVHNDQAEVGLKTEVYCHMPKSALRGKG